MMYSITNIVDISFVHTPIIGTGVVSVIAEVLECFPTALVKTFKVKNHQITDIVEGSIPLDGTLYRIAFPPNVLLEDVVKTLYSTYSMLGYKTAVIACDRAVGVSYDDEFAIFN